MAKICTVAIHKGGTGKTTGAVHLAFRAAESGYRTLLVDLDAQGNASDTMGTDLPEDCLMAAELFLLADTPLRKRPIHQYSDLLHVLPASEDLLAVERLPLEAADVFRTQLRDLGKDYDLIVVDTPPTMGFAMLAPLLASDFAFAPVVPDAYSVNGVRRLIEKIEEIKASSNPDLRFLGLLVNRWNRRSAVQEEIINAFKGKLKKYVMPHVLPDSTAISNAALNREPVWKNAKTGSQRKAAKEVRGVMDWLLKQAKLPKVAVAR